MVIEIVDLPIQNGDFPCIHGDLPIKNGDFPCNYHGSLGIGISSARIGILCGPSRSDRPHGAGASGPVRVEVSEVRSAAQQVSMVCWEVHGSYSAWIYSLKMVIFHSYVSLPEGKL